MSINELATILRYSGSRSLLHLPSKISVGEGIQIIMNNFSELFPDDTEFIIVTFQKIYLKIPRTSMFQIAQINQVLLNLLLSSPNRVLILEMATNWGHMSLSPNLGQILTISTDYKSAQEFTETARFLSGTTLKIGPLDLTRYYGQIGYLLCMEECFKNPFDYQGIPVTIKLEPQQYAEYLDRLEKERVMGRPSPYSAIQATNFLYPEHLQKLHNIPREIRPVIISDFPTTEGGWITEDILSDLSKLSPKMGWLLNFLRKNSGKHCVWSSFSQSNGVHLIRSIIQLAGFQVIQMTGTDSVRERHQKIEEFNQSQNIVLVTDLYAFTGLKDVRSFVMMEQHPYSSILNSYLREIATGSQQEFVTVIFLVAVGPKDQPTVDVLNYRILSQQLISVQTMLDILKTGQLQPDKLQTYQQAFERENLSLNGLQQTIERTFQKIIL